MKNFLGIIILIVLIAACYSAVADNRELKTLRYPAIQDITNSTNSGQWIKIATLYSENPTNYVRVPISFEGLLSADFEEVPKFIIRRPGDYQVSVLVKYDGTDLLSTNDAEVFCYVRIDNQEQTVLVLTKQRRLQAGQQNNPEPDPADDDEGEAPPSENPAPDPVSYSIQASWNAYDTNASSDVVSLQLRHRVGLAGDFEVIGANIPLTDTNLVWVTSTPGQHNFLMRGKFSDGTFTSDTALKTITIP